MFTLTATHQSGARCGVLQTGHGDIATPFFMPIATKAAVKTISPNELQELERAVDSNTAPILLSNTYHLYLKPGLEILKQHQGLHGFMNWDHAILTDSGGFQIFSLAKLRTLTDQGVEFSSHIDGSKHLFTPERSMEIQSVIGADIWMAFDYFPGYPATQEQGVKSVELTTAWAKRCKEWFSNYTKDKKKGAHQLFGIVQGSTFTALRTRSAQEITECEFDGYAIGGLAVGEPPEEMYRIVEHTIPHLPEQSPRYLMGVGPPDQILEAVKRGVDMFDCVIPSRNARHGTVYTSTEGSDGQLVDSALSSVQFEKVNIRADKWSSDQRPVDPQCTCNTCTSGLSRSYIRHLFTVDEPLGSRLLTEHNIHFYMTLMKQIRDAIT